MTDINLLEDYLAWRTSHDGESRDVSPTAYYEHLENLKNAETLQRLRGLNLQDRGLHIQHNDNAEAAVEWALETLAEVHGILNGEADND